MPQTDLKIPKIAVIVELAVDGGELVRVEVFVAEHADRAYRRQHLLDLLEGPAPFLPGRDVDSNEWAAHNKEAITWVAVPLSAGSLPIEEAETSATDEPLYDIVRDVSVVLCSGETKRGQLLYSPPEGQSRVSDYLNANGRFFRLWTSERLFLINKRYVLRVVEHPNQQEPAPDEAN